MFRCKPKPCWSEAIYSLLLPQQESHSGNIIINNISRRIATMVSLDSPSIPVRVQRSVGIAYYLAASVCGGLAVFDMREGNGHTHIFVSLYIIATSICLLALVGISFRSRETMLSCSSLFRHMIGAACFM